MKDSQIVDFDWKIVNFDVLTSNGIRLQGNKNNFAWNNERVVRYRYAVHEEDVQMFDPDMRPLIEKEFSAYVSSHFGDDLSEFEQEIFLDAYMKEYYMSFEYYHSEEYQVMKNARI